MKNLNTHLSSVDIKSFGVREETLGANCTSAFESLQGKHVVIGIGDDRGVAANAGFTGAKDGPASFRKAFYKLYDCQLRNLEQSRLSSLVVDIGDVKLTADIESTHERLSEVVAEVLAEKPEMIFVIGGGHDFSFGSFSGHARRFPNQLIPVVNLDAHLDLRQPGTRGEINSGTPFYRIIENHREAVANGAALLELGIQRERNPHSLYQYALSHSVTVIEYVALQKLWRHVKTQREASPMDHVQLFLEQCRELGWSREQGSLHLSVDLDVFAQSVAPGTSASTPFGASVESLAQVLAYVAKSRCARVVDIAELCPSRDVSESTARLAAQLVYNMMCLREELGKGSLVDT